MEITANIKERIRTLTKKQSMVASYMLEHPDRMAYSTLKDLSRDIGVTEITILNTCQSLGYENYNEVKYEFRKLFLVSYKTDVVETVDSYSEKVPKYELGDKEQLLKQVGKEEIETLDTFWKEIDFEEIFAVANAVLESRKIFICGRGISAIMADVLNNRLSACEIFATVINTELNDSAYGMFSTIDKDTLIIAISFPDYYFMTTKIAEFAKEKNAKVLAITDRKDSDVAEFADMVLAVPTMSRVFLNTTTGAVFLLNLLTTAIKIQKDARS